MILSIIFWILGGSALLWVLLINALGITYVLSLIKRLIMKNRSYNSSNKESK